MPYILFGIVVGVLIGIAMVIAIAVACVRWHQRSRRTRKLESLPDELSVHELDLSIDLDALKATQVPAAYPRLELLGTPARLVVLVLAPVGRGTNFPTKEHWHQVVDRVVPGLARVLDHHRPIFRRWPEQVSQKGFVHAFWNAMRTRSATQETTSVTSTTSKTSNPQWYRLAGRVDWQGQSVLIGLVLCGEGPAMDSMEVDHPGRWLDLIKVRVA